MINKINNLYTFGEYVLNMREENLWHNDKLIPLPPKVFQTLAMLVSGNGQTITKEELIAKIWPDSFVEESNLSQNIYTLRQLFGKENKFIVTVPKKGYYFAAQVKVLDDEQELKNSNAATPQKTESSTAEFHLDNKRAIDTSRRQISLIKRSAGFALIGLIFLALLLAAGKFIRPSSILDNDGPVEIEFSKLTDNNNSFNPVISPDGNFIAYQKRENGKTGMRLMDVRSGLDVEVNIGGNHRPGRFIFSADSKEIFFRSRSAMRSAAPLFRISYFGGQPQLVKKDVWSNFSLSPDGKKIAYFKADPQQNTEDLISYNIETLEEEKVFRLTAPDLFFMISAPVWSPDGKKIAMIKREGKALRSDITVVDVETKIPETLKTELHKIFELFWMPDGKSILATSKEPDKGRQVWKVNYPSGTTSRITNDLNNYDGLSVSSDGRYIVSETNSLVSNLSLLSGQDLQTSRSLTEGTYGQSALISLRFTTDDTLVFDSREALSTELWSLKLTDNVKVELTKDSGTENTHITHSLDGKTVYYTSTSDGSRSIWQVDVDGTNLKKLTFAEGETHWFPTISHDGKSIIYFVRTTDSNEIRRRSLIDSTETVIYRVKDFIPIHFFEASPDGKYLAFAYANNTEDAAQAESDEPNMTNFAFLHLDGSDKVEKFKLDSSSIFVRFSAKENSFDYVAGNKLKRKPNADPNGEAEVVFEIPDETIYNFDRTSDERSLAIAKGSKVSDIILLKIN